MPLYYGDYLQLDQLLSSQHPESEKRGAVAHDEMLFIITHQTYELWFKQLLYELESVITLLDRDYVDESSLGTVAGRLERMRAIQQLLIQQIAILETMTPLDFLEFRGHLTPASGFQSVQFRCLEQLIGVAGPSTILPASATEREHRLWTGVCSHPSLYQLVEAWLARIPFLETKNFDFTARYRQAVEQMLARDSQVIAANPTLDDARRQVEQQGLEATRESFRCLLDAGRYGKLKADGRFRMRRQAVLAALFIHLYRDEPILHLPFRLLTNLLELDELLTTWRYHHAMLAHRMLGTKIGTGGSSGHEYLKRSIEEKRIFIDLFNLPTFLIPRSAIPTLPVSVKQMLGFHFGGRG